MVANVLTACLYGHHALDIKVEVDILLGLPHIHIVGLGDNSVKEARSRIRAAIQNAGFKFPLKHIIINLAPSEQPKQGNLCELAIAIGILVASEQIDGKYFEDKMILGALSLDGSIQTSSGLLTTILSISNRSIKPSIVVPSYSLDNIYCLKQIPLYHIKHLKELHQTQNIAPYHIQSQKAITQPTIDVDMKQVIGLEYIKKAFAFSIIGKHHALLIGAPGSGKSMLAKAVQGIMPPLSHQEICEVTQLYSAAGLIQNTIITERPFRHPHHTTSEVALVGGGSIPKPGEISLSHRGVLFLDELIEFPSQSIQAIREPLQDKKISISRSKGRFCFPADFIFIGATNPCKCGFFLSQEQACTCRATQVQTLLNKIIGPFSDRIPLEIQCSLQNYHTIMEKNEVKNSLWWQSKIIEAQKRMLHRNKGLYNSELTAERLFRYINCNSTLKELVFQYVKKLLLSHRKLTTSLQLCLSIMDFYEKSQLTKDIILEAFRYNVMYRYRDALNIIQPTHPKKNKLRSHLI